MAENTVIPPGTGGDTIASDEVTLLNGAASSLVKVQRIKECFGDDNTSRDVSPSFPLPVGTYAPDVFALTIPPSAPAANKIFFDLFNATGSGSVLRVISVEAIKDGSVANTGVLGINLFLTRTTAIGTAGTAAVSEGTSLTAANIAKLNPGTTNLPAQVTSRNIPTAATGGAVLGYRCIFAEETNSASYDPVDFMAPNSEIFVPENTGIRVVQGTIAATGLVGFRVLFTLRPKI